MIKHPVIGINNTKLTTNNIFAQVFDCKIYSSPRLSTWQSGGDVSPKQYGGFWQVPSILII